MRPIAVTQIAVQEYKNFEIVSVKEM
jgi:hypothetical protein